MLIVKKYGGSSVANAERIYNVARQCIKDYNEGHSVIVVLSAMGKTTDGLIQKAEEICSKPNKREMDMLLATGEQISVSLMAMAMQEMNIPAVSLNAFQVAMHTTQLHTNARIKEIDKARIRHELENRRIVVVTGFQGIDKYDDLTTLGRGGSDTTAVALAAALHADKCEIYTDVDGVFTADPRIVPDASKLKEITYDEMLEMATLGAKVLHNRSVELARKYGVTLEVRSSLNNVEGTIVKEETKMEKMLVCGVAADKNTARISLVGLKDVPGVAFKVFNILAKQNINVDMILQSIGRENSKDITFTVPAGSLDESIEALEAAKEVLSFDHISNKSNVSKVSVIGSGMATNPGVAAKMFEALYNAGINIKMISTSEIRVTVLIEEEDTELAVRAIHEAFRLKDI